MPTPASVCLDFPIQNFSAESPDEPFFCQTVTVKADHPLGVCVAQDSDTRICCSEVSDLEAYLCALRQAQEIIWNTWKQNTCQPPNCPPFCNPSCPPPPCSPPADPPNCEPSCGQPPNNFIGIYRNDSQTCTKLCPDGSTFTLTVPHGKIVALSQQSANAQAFALACKLAREFKLCLEVIGGTTFCKNDYSSFVIKANGPLSQSPLESVWTITGPGIAPVNLFTYDSEASSLFGTRQIRIFGTPTISIDTHINARIDDLNTGYYMEKQIPITVENCTAEWGNITPTIMSNAITYWASSINLDPGTYRIAYVNGAWRPGPLPLWVVGDGGGSPARGFVIVYDNGISEVDFPTSGIYGSQADAEAATAGLSKIINHAGGKIGMYLRDSPYGDNIAGTPNPTFKLEVM